MKTCKEFCDCISDYLDGDMSEDLCRLLEDHLDRCPPCQLMYQSLATTVEICSQSIPAEIPDDVRENLRRFLREHCGQDSCEPKKGV